MGIDEMTLTPAEQFAAWSILIRNRHVFDMGKYYYVGMTAPRRMPKSWFDVDCHLLGLLTERSNSMLDRDSKWFIERYILGHRYKK